MAQQADRFNVGKLDMSYCLPEWRMMLADLGQMGAVKYSRGNFRRGFPEEGLIASMDRHIAEAQMGTIFDHDTGCMHWTQAGWNAIVLGMQSAYKRLGQPMSDQASYEAFLAEMYDPVARKAFLKEYSK